ncbi:sensor histidine kinase [Sulfitobacter donghicola]|uniref:histidine kinase n=1 Tax=Sulfitobacter donghicola DSW-25 = KCTC 12864 = JCM 14565 TaxID=1300350 RepID=A0A073IG94_9RHOB|nr:ATP-binding protein [Sulfitobacter donghicola]KEJ88535.1 ATPase [Sulfitobacter donghicola DSW-25 = KCTC 12864 = JCM 14565]KIN69582.1 Phosphate regulon sensor histidine kinase [Sulfitobacter donghicola DSW-25 = KCTC 12864 = JCM 14565]
MSASLPVSNLIAAMPLPSLAISQSEQIIALNAAAQKLLGVPAKGGHFITVLRQPSVVEAVERCLKGTGPTTATYLTREGSNDTTYTVSVSLVENTGIALVTFQDITMVTAAGQMRRDFVANVSHELRTPLTAVMGFIETLQGPARNDAPARERFLGIMQAETERMNRLVGDLLSLSRVEADERVRPVTQVDIVGIVASTIRSLTPLATEANVSFVVDLPEDPVMLAADMDQLLQVFTNLIENAIKYGGRDRNVYVTLEKRDRVNAFRASGVVVSVRDEGLGIDQQHLPRLTERFYRVDSHRSREIGGTGLGLAIVKHILNRHRGRLKVQSKLGEGSEFIVLLPLEQARNSV